MKTTRFCCLYLTVKTCSFHQFCFSIFLPQTVPMLQNHILLIFLSTISPNSTTWIPVNCLSHTLKEKLINSAITDFTLWCGIFVFRVEKADAGIEKALFLQFNVCIALMVILLFWTGQSILIPEQHSVFWLWLSICLYISLDIPITAFESGKMEKETISHKITLACVMNESKFKLWRAHSS